MGVPTSPKLPPLKKQGEKLLPGRIKLKHLCARNTQMSPGTARPQTHLPSAFPSGGLGWRPIRVGNPHHRKRFLWSSLSPFPCNSSSHISLSLSLELYPGRNTQCQKQPLALKTPERQLYFRWYLPSILTHPAFFDSGWKDKWKEKQRNTQC